ncbi:MAG TPA: isochorismatase family protein [Candidatus Kapabacteria bacterium]|jgi:nicotinamidase-related amidase|nr:isochorismatase family protein [Candidatus Kapabacteria bacterium]
MTERNDSILVVVDVQERMMPVIDRSDAVTDAVLRLVRGFRALDLPILVTEQYSKGLGHTVPSVREALAEWYRPIEKITFSAAGELHFMQQLEGAARNHAIICGVETHVCVFQTARDLAMMGWEVEVVADAVGSRAPGNREVALDRLSRRGVELTSVEMVLFDLMQRADIAEFKAVSAIVK